MGAWRQSMSIILFFWERLWGGRQVEQASSFLCNRGVVSTFAVRESLQERAEKGFARERGRETADAGRAQRKVAECDRALGWRWKAQTKNRPSLQDSEEEGRKEGCVRTQGNSEQESKDFASQLEDANWPFGGMCSKDERESYNIGSPLRQDNLFLISARPISKITFFYSINRK